MFGIGSKEMVIFLIIVLIIFGPTKLPQLARSIGRSMKEFKDGMSEFGNEVKSTASQSTTSPKTPDQEAIRRDAEADTNKMA